MKKLIAQLDGWFDQRTGYKEIVHEALFERVPGGARWRYVWGSTLVFAFIVQAVTGFLLFFLASAHLLQIILQPDQIGPYASSDRIWSGRFWLLYAPLLLVVHLHAGIGFYRLWMKWAPPASAAGRVRLRRAMWGVVAFFILLGTASLLTYMQIGREHADRLEEQETERPGEAGAVGDHAEQNGHRQEGRLAHGEQGVDGARALRELAVRLSLRERVVGAREQTGQEEGRPARPG